MSLHSYRVSREIAATDYPFDTLIMAAMSKADSQNQAFLQLAFPQLWAEVYARYNAPGARLPSDGA